MIINSLTRTLFQAHRCNSLTSTALQHCKPSCLLAAADLVLVPVPYPMSANKRWHSSTKQDESDSENDQNHASNQALQGVIQQGIKELKSTANLIQSKKETKKSLFHKAAVAEMGPTNKQLAEANRVLTVAVRCLEEMQHQKKTNNNDVLSIRGHSILLLQCEVNANLWEATLYWSPPFEILLEADDTTREGRNDGNYAKADC